MNSPDRDLEQRFLKHRTRRHFFKDCALGLGKIALASLLLDRKLSATQQPQGNNPLAPRPPHFPASVKSVIFLFMAGGPSQLEMWDYKPQLLAMDNQPIPQSFLEGRRFAFMSSFTAQVPRLLAPRRTACRSPPGPGARRSISAARSTRLAYRPLASWLTPPVTSMWIRAPTFSAA